MLIDNGEVIIEESNLIETFIDHYVNIMEKYSGNIPCNFVSNTNALEDDVIIN